MVITGGDSSISLTTAQEFLGEGAKIVVAGRNATLLSEAQERFGSNAIVVAADVTNSEDLENLVEVVRDKHGRIDVLFVNAGITKLASFVNMSEEVFDEIFDTNIRGAYFTIQKALPLIVDGGAIVLTTSWFVEVEVAGTSAVSATKAALRSLTRTLASELLARGIRVNAVCRGVIAASLFSKLGDPEEKVVEIGKSLPARIPEKRIGTAKEIAKAIVFLASTDASSITGVELELQGTLQQKSGEAKVPRSNGREVLAPWQVQRTKDLIASRISESVSLAELARDCQLSVSHFARAFKRSIGVAPHRWLVEQKMEHGKRLLKSTSLTITAIALECGFSHRVPFSNAFRRTIGVNPSEWRRTHYQK